MSQSWMPLPRNISIDKMSLDPCPRLLSPDFSRSASPWVNGVQCPAVCDKSLEKTPDLKDNRTAYQKKRQ